MRANIGRTKNVHELKMEFRESYTYCAATSSVNFIAEMTFCNNLTDNMIATFKLVTVLVDFSCRRLREKDVIWLNQRILTSLNSLVRTTVLAVISDLEARSTWTSCTV